MAVKRVSETRMEIREGGGCMSIFGLPFLAAGLFMLFLAAGIISPDNASDLQGWGRLMPFAVGLIFTLAGGLLVFGRSRMVVDVAEGSVVRHRGLLSVPVQSRSFPLNAFHAVVLTLEPGDSDSQEAYPVTLKGSDPAGNLKISSNADYALSLDTARQLSGFLKLPLEDATTDHIAVSRADELDKPLAQRLQGSPEEVWAVRPVSMKSKVEMLSGGLKITIPGGGFRVIMLLPLVILTAVLSYVLPALMDFFQRSHTPDFVQWVFAGFIVLIAGVIPVLSAVRGLIVSVRGYTEIWIAAGRIEIAERRFRRRKIASIAFADIYGLDYSNAQTRIGQSSAEYRMRPPTHASPDAGLPVRPLPSWIKALTRLTRSKGVIVKHRQGFYSFGAGLPDDEVTYLYSLVRRALAGKL